MRWETYNRPKDGETRVITRFAFLPKKLDDGYTVFLERYSVKQRFLTSPGGNYRDGGFWTNVRTFNNRSEDDVDSTR